MLNGASLTRVDRVRSRVVVALCAFAMSAVSLAAATPASASVSGYFCGSNINYAFIAGGAKCADSNYHNFTGSSPFVYGYIPTQYYSFYDLCTLAKQTFIDHYPDGGGGANTLPFLCTSSFQSIYTFCVAGYLCTGYAELYNRFTTVNGSFWGYLVANY